MNARVGFFSRAGVEVKGDIPEGGFWSKIPQNWGRGVLQILNFEEVTFMYNFWKDRLQVYVS